MLIDATISHVKKLRSYVIRKSQPSTKSTVCTHKLPDWPMQISGVSYSPFRARQDPALNSFPTHDQIKNDFDIIKNFTQHIRTYTVAGASEQLAYLANESNLNVCLGIELTACRESNIKEIERAIHTTKNLSNITSLMVGNECLLTKTLTYDELVSYINIVKINTTIPVSTAEPWHVWLEYTELVHTTDYLAIHIHPFWEHIPVEEASDYTFMRLEQLRSRYPDKKIFLAEIGWPSAGGLPIGKSGEPEAQAKYLREVVYRLEQDGQDYFIAESFDQPWKLREGSVGQFWGIFNQHRKQKFNFQGDLILLKGSPSKTLLKALTHSPQTFRNTILLSSLIIAAAAALIFWLMIIPPTKPIELFLLTCSFTLWLLAMALAFYSETHEFIECIWPLAPQRDHLPVPASAGPLPKVSIHLPCCNEPPEMVIQSLNALAALNYADYEVLIIDNNTSDDQTWKPIQAHCEALGKQFRFFHVDTLPGYKAGALNYLLERTSSDAQIIGVVDADYCVRPDWLSRSCVFFDHPQLALFQCPQDYRDERDNFFKLLCHYEYQLFFQVGMVIRNNHNAIIQHGTMTLVRRSVLDKLRWADWCICEDSELGLRILEQGHDTFYLRESMGKGLTPDTFTDFKKQRSRWAYGAVQIMKRHRNSLLFNDKKSLDWHQRYYFITGWLPWLGDGLSLLITLLAIGWTGCSLYHETLSSPVHPLVILPLTTLMILKIIKVSFFYRKVMGLAHKNALYSTLAGLALSHTIGKAVIYGLCSHRRPFHRTPKKTNGAPALMPLGEAIEEFALLTLLMACITAAIFVPATHNLSSWLWIFFLIQTATPYCAALLMAYLSSRANYASASEKGVEQL